eukprot:g29043.t1
MIWTPRPAESGPFFEDWSLKGPTVALKNTLAAAVVAWILVVPLGVVTHSLLNYFTSLIIVAAASLLILSVFLQFGLCGGWLFALLILSVFIVFGGSMVWLISGPLGGAVIFLVAFFCTRVIFGVIFLRDLDPSAWPHVKEVEKNSDEFRSQKDSWQPDQLGPNQPVLADEALKPFSPHRPPNSSLLARKLKLLKPVGPP